MISRSEVSDINLRLVGPRQFLLGHGDKVFGVHKKVGNKLEVCPIGEFKKHSNRIIWDIRFLREYRIRDKLVKRIRFFVGAGVEIYYSVLEIFRRVNFRDPNVGKVDGLWRE